MFCILYDVCFLFSIINGYDHDHYRDNDDDDISNNNSSSNSRLTDSIKLRNSICHDC